MRKYTTPTLEVVKLLVREDMAAKKVTSLNGSWDGNTNTTTYDITNQVVSEANKPEDPTQQP